MKKKPVVIVVMACILVLLGLLVWRSFKQTPRTVTVVGLGKQSFPATAADIGILYYFQSQSKNDAANLGANGFRNTTTSLKNMGATSVSQSISQVVPLTATTGQPQTYEFRQGAIVHVVGQDKIQQVLSTLQSTDVIVTQTNFLPQEDAAVNSALYTAAFNDAMAKAQNLAQLSHGKVGRVMNVATSDTANSNTATITNDKQTSTTAPAYSSIDLQKSVTVSFELE